MRLARACTALFLLTACGGGDVPPTEGPSSSGSTAVPSTADAARASRPGNRPPHATSVRIEPRAPQSRDTLRVALNALDPDGDRLSFDIRWFHNGLTAQTGSSFDFAPEQLARGDRVWAEVTVRDASEAVTLKTEPVVVGNAAPLLSSVRLMPEQPTGSMPLIVEAKAEDPDGDPVELRYAWFRNDERLEGADGPSLEAGTVKRGDRIQVGITPTDGRDEGDRFLSKPVVIQNGAPKIESQPAQTMAGANRYEYQIVARDPDGDSPLRYELVKGPPGMAVDFMSGLVSWTVPENVQGRFDIKLSVSDVYGSKTEQSYAIDLAWDSLN